MVKERLDRLLVNRGLFISRSQAYAAIIAGDVKVGGHTCRKPDQRFAAGAAIDFSDRRKYVSRGGVKLAKALREFSISVKGLTALDIGASTGGFTDCLLREGAGRVIAVDVGYGQLAWKLRNDERVTVLERMNARYLKPADLPAPADLAAIDVAFISLTKVLTAVAGCLVEEAPVLALVKPQFEIGKGRLGGKGVVRRPEDHEEVLIRTIRYSAANGFSVLGLSYSPILGPKGNIEFWLHLSKKTSVGYAINDIVGLASSIVREAHAELT